jgi:nucleoside-diphosphate-sugar epimerase
MRNIVITGATSMIGCAIARCALEQGLEILCIIRKDSNRLENIPKSSNIKIIYADISEYKNIDIAENYNVFFHLAWDKTFGASRDDVDIQVNNIQYTLDAVRLAKQLGCKKFVGAGSQAEYGLVSVPLTSNIPVNPQSGYGIAKYSAGKLSRLLCTQLGMEYNWVRILSIYGPLDSPHTLIMYTISELLAGRSPELTRCEQIWDYLYCDDAARAFLAIGEKGIDGKVYPLGSGNHQKLSEYIELIRNIVKPDGVLQLGEKEYYPHQPMYLYADISELTADTGWKAKIPFEEGIKRIILYHPTPPHPHTQPIHNQKIE